MKELTAYRQKLLARWEQAAHEFATACAQFAPFDPITGSDWNAHQIAAHTRDVDKFVYGERVRRTLQENTPLLKNFDADEWMQAHYDSAEPIENITRELVKSVVNACNTLRDLPDGIWSRESHHETLGGGLTLQLWVERSLAHLEEHLQTLNKR